MKMLAPYAVYQTLVRPIQKLRNRVRETFTIHGTVLAHMHLQLQVQSRDVTIHCSLFCKRRGGGARILYAVQ